jgi:hypothetical protein
MYFDFTNVLIHMQPGDSSLQYLEARARGECSGAVKTSAAAAAWLEP